MTFTFLDMTNKTLFVRDDAERASWTVEEMTLDADFPYDPSKIVSIGQRVFFKDPATGRHQIYEVKQPRTFQPDGYQQITAENICISELSDEHIDGKEITKKKCRNVLSDLLEGTLWGIGKTDINPVSTVDLSRGSVWQAILQLKDAYNVDIVPNVTLNTDGTITRKLDIVSPEGEFKGMRLSIDKNLIDPCVIYDDTEVATALFGYGGTIQAKDPKEEDKECTFEDVKWSKTDEHPAKPKGQKYLEDKDATRLYGRDGRPRYGYYQNNDITDPELLLEKTWETLKTTRIPAISIEGTVADLYRMGYADTPLILREKVLVDIKPDGFKSSLQLIKLTVDLLDPTATVVTIGAYIPNIVYIERKTNESATGSRGGGGGNKSTVPEAKEFEAKIESINEGTAIRIRAFQNDLDDTNKELKLQEGRITVEHNRISQEVTDRREADKELSGQIEVTAQSVTQIVTAIGSDGRVTAASIVTAINNGHGSITLSAETIDLNGLVSYFEAEGLSCGDLDCQGSITVDQDVTAEGTVSGLAGSFDDLHVDNGKLEVGTEKASWKSKVITTYNLSDFHAFMYRSGDTTPTILGKLVTSTAESTIYYLGHS